MKSTPDSQHTPKNRQLPAEPQPPWGPSPSTQPGAMFKVIPSVNIMTTSKAPSNRAAAENKPGSLVLQGPSWPRGHSSRHCSGGASPTNPQTPAGPGRWLSSLALLQLLPWASSRQTGQKGHLHVLLLPEYGPRLYPYLLHCTRGSSQSGNQPGQRSVRVHGVPNMVSTTCS